MQFYTRGMISSIMLDKLTYGYLTAIHWLQYFHVLNLYRRMQKFKYISENRHIVISESHLHYLTIDNWFHNFRLFNLFNCSEQCECTYIQFVEHILARRNKRLFLLVFIWFLLQNHKHYYFIDYTDKTSTCLILYFRRKFY